MHRGGATQGGGGETRDAQMDTLKRATKEAMAAVPGSFGLSVGEQRLRLATDLVRAWAPASIVDLGCGDAKAISRIVASLAQPPRAVSAPDALGVCLVTGGAGFTVSYTHLTLPTKA